ncbi:protein NEDD1-like isoform X2 [Amblyomma americanum]
MFATAAEDVRVWSSASLQQCCQFDVVRAPKVSSVSWNADGKQLASIARNQDVVLFTAFGSGQPRHTLMQVESACVCCQFSHRDTDFVCLGLCDGTVQLLKKGKAVYSYKVHKETMCVTFSSDDGFVASGASDGSVALLQLETKCAQCLGEPTGEAVMGLQWSPHGRFQLLSCSTDGQLSVWDASTRRLKGRHCLHPGRVATALSLSPVNEALVVTVGLDSRLVLFDMATASEQASVRTPECLESVAFLPDGQRVVVGASSGRVYLYDLRNTRQTPPTVLGAHTAPVTAIATMQSTQVEAQMAVLEHTSDAGSRANLIHSTPSGPGLEQGDAGAARFQFDLVKPILRPSLSPADYVDSSGSPGNVFTEGPCNGRSLMDASWVSAEGNAQPRKQFRLSDFMPVLADSSLSTGPSFWKSPMASPREEDIQAGAASAAGAAADVALEAPMVINGSEASQSHHSVRVESASSSSAPMTPEKATKDQSLSDGRLARAAEPDQPEALVRRLEDTINERTRHLDAHLRHIHIQLSLMQRTFMGEVQTMLQEVFDEVLSLRTIIDEMREPI